MQPAEDTELAKTTYLVEKAQAGDRDALNDLFTRYAPRVQRIVALRVGRTASAYGDIEDIAQIALMGLFENLKRFEHRSEGSFRNWLARCVENAITDQFRQSNALKRGKGKVRRFGDCGCAGLAALLYPAGGPTPSEVACAEELESRLEKELLKMPEHHREVIILRKLCQMSYGEVARTMGFGKQGTARQVCARALSKLWEAIQT